jgi:hypothetical protein
MNRAFRILWPFLAACSLHAQDAAPDPEPEPAVVPVTESETLSAREGQETLVQGRVSRTRVNSSGIHFLEFEDTPFVCVTFAQQVAAFPDGPPSEIYKDQWVRVRGRIEQFRGAPQIKLAAPDQIEVIPAPAAEPAPVAMPVTPENPEPAPVAAAPAAPAPAVPSGAETVDGIPALDWRKFFPESKEKEPRP